MEEPLLFEVDLLEGLFILLGLEEHRWMQDKWETIDGYLAAWPHGNSGDGPIPSLCGLPAWTLRPSLGV